MLGNVSNVCLCHQQVLSERGVTCNHAKVFSSSVKAVGPSTLHRRSICALMCPCERVYECFLPTDSDRGGGCPTMASAIGNKLKQEGHSTALYNSSSHVLRTDSLAAVEHATSQEEVHIVGSKPFLLFPSRWTMDGEGGGVGGRERDAEGKHFYSFFVEDTGMPRKKYSICRLTVCVVLVESTVVHFKVCASVRSSGNCLFPFFFFPQSKMPPLLVHNGPLNVSHGLFKRLLLVGRDKISQ